ncbi:MAG: hypothetical protein NT002_14555 [candidate division Zixibacteria bacterium]|nr:hypothetical protein [candidate division Zixibacteria bacterium]
MIPILSFILIAVGIYSAFSQEPDSSNSIYYAGQTFVSRITAPKGWVIDLENAQADGRSAACYPTGQKYYDYDRIVYIWIFKRDSLSFREFLTADSARYLKKYPGVAFRKKDSLVLAEDRKICFMETVDPGGKSNIATVAYADAGTETIVFELNITRPVLFAETESVFIQMLKKFSQTRREE